ncbi:MAG: MotA/TolQ/ExbB proton channel family protein [Planctomycetota bacterium]|nr:MotA/TolQ/ExbB proton channel family protein [Planctomycetota bacterium]MDA1214348.1 MotA/TolQ/ExbB proton channel family protein [Planctomycetota bacterium]
MIFQISLIAGAGLIAQSDMVREIISASGTIGLLIVVLSLFMVAMIIEHLLTLRASSQIPRGMTDLLRQAIEEKRIVDASQACADQDCLLGQIMSAGLEELPMGFAAVEKSMEDACQEQSARLLRKIEYLSVIGTIAPMLGLLGTVWGMILAFMEFEQKANPQVAELAPGIYKALVTTLEGLSVAIPALAFYAYFRNRVDELVARAARTAEHIFAELRRRQQLERRSVKGGQSPSSATNSASEHRPRIPPVALERDV